MEQALIEMAKQIAKLQEENERLKHQITKPTRRSVKINPEQERHDRVSRWVLTQYEKGWSEVQNKKENVARIAKIRKHKPAYIPKNDCMDYWPKEVTQMNGSRKNKNNGTRN